MFKLKFPEGKIKAFTLSYDDGSVHDKRFAETLARYAIKATLNIQTREIGFDAGKLSWDEIKEAEKRLTTGSKNAAQVARSLPALIYADKVQTRVARTGFDWPDAHMAMDKVEEEARELRQALNEDSNVEEELGDLLFAAVNVARLRGLDPEETLMRATDKFRRRFARVEEAAGDKLSDMDIEQLVSLWKQMKASE